MSKELVSYGEDFVVEWVDRGFGGARRVAIQVNGLDGSVNIGGLVIDKNGNVSAPVYNNTTRPSAATMKAGSQIWNSDDNAPNYSDGSAWRDAVGNLT